MSTEDIFCHLAISMCVKESCEVLTTRQESTKTSNWNVHHHQT